MCQTGGENLAPGRFLAGPFFLILRKSYGFQSQSQYMSTCQRSGSFCSYDVSIWHGESLKPVGIETHLT